MIELFGEYYYIDFKELDKFLLMNKNDDKTIKTTDVEEIFDASNNLISKSVVKKEHISHKEIDGVKWEIVRNFIADIGDEGLESDPKMGETSLEKTSIRFKLAFNTLLAYGLLKKLD